MYVLDLDGANCISCGICRDCCPPGAIDMRVQTHSGVETFLFVTAAPRFETFLFLAAPASCNGCLLCVHECPVGALSVYELSALGAPRHRLPCAEVYAERAERRRALVLRRAAEDVRPPRDL